MTRIDVTITTTPRQPTNATVRGQLNVIQKSVGKISYQAMMGCMHGVKPTANQKIASASTPAPRNLQGLKRRKE